MESNFYDSLGQPKMAAQSPDYLVGDEVGYSAITANVSSGSLTAGTRSGALQSVTINGDGVNPVWVEWNCYAPYVSAGTAGGHFNIELWDGTVGSGTQLQSSQYVANTVGQSSGQASLMYRLAPFTGTKTLNIAVLRVDTATATIILQAGATTPMILRATKLKSAGLYAPPVARGYISSNVSRVSDTTGAIISFNAENYDSNRLHDTSVNPSRFTADRSGVWRIHGAVRFSANATGSRVVTLYKNGASYEFISQALSAGGTFATVVPYSTSLLLKAGDYIEIAATQNSGSTLNLETPTTHCCFEYVGPGVEVANRSGQRAATVKMTAFAAGTAVAAGDNTPEMGRLTITGDGVSWLNLRAYVSHAGTSVAGNAIGLRIFDGAPAVGGFNTVELAYGYSYPVGANTWNPLFVEMDYPPFTGTKIFTVALHSPSASTISVHEGSAYTAQGQTLYRAQNNFTATWV